MISNAQTQEIREYLISRRLTDTSLIDDLLDHISCEIESLMALENIVFSEAYERAKEKILPADPFQVQQELMLLTTKTSNIMFKKIAFLGAYASALCLIAAIALFTISSLNDRKIELLQYHIQAEYMEAVKVSDSKYKSQKWQDQLTEEKDASYMQLIQSQTLFLVCLIIFSITYLPYRFYSGFQKQPEQAHFA